MKEIMGFVSFLALFIAVLALLRAYDLIPTWLVLVLLLPVPITVAVLCVRWLIASFRPVSLPIWSAERQEEKP